MTGFQVGSKTFSARGEEAYIPETDIESFGLFTVQSLEVGDFIYEFGLRAERQSWDQPVRRVTTVAIVLVAVPRRCGVFAKTPT